MDGTQTRSTRKTSTDGGRSPKVGGHPKAPAAESPKKRIPVGGLIVGAVVVLVLAAIIFGGGDIAAETGSPAISGTDLPLFSSGQVDGAVGMAAPTVSGEDFDGNVVTIDSAGQPTAVLFLAHWCPHCQAEVIEVSDWLEAGGGVDGVNIVSVATATDPVRDNYPPSVWLSDWTPPVLLDDADRSVLTAFGGNAFPFWAFLDGDGRVVARHAGSLGIPGLVEMMMATK